ncbi:TAXI family TRAP transporter solute-binding subunit [Streptomyces sp. TRM66268-LWL]|uniref:TAXI family TRAP transporter solute-binding subunit n=1 Tax=Streptomyces polyasparticus TaxID=2767826 RepID=A0ABR7SS30_9ACTN|nr:TAXI family TRAP transporter solute-binding subunit [Streptomyces polyasparticus]MBC9718312.1 TAXI family TRAP transporter solute-binding subunit [Streptomyces polyasparticus]
MPLTLPRLSRRRAFEGAAAGLVVFGLLLWWLLPLGEDLPDGKVVFSTGGASGVYEVYGNELKKAVADDLPDLDIDLRGSRGSKENVQRVATGKADFTIAAADAVRQYQQDQAPGWDRLRGCVRLYDDYVHLVVRDDSPVTTVKDLKGKRVVVGPEGSGVRIIAERVLAAAGLGLDDIEAVDTASQAAGPSLTTRDVDAFFWSGGLTTPFVKDLSTRTDIRLVELDAALVDKLHRQGGRSSYYRAATVPADAYPKVKNKASVQTIAVANLLVTTERADTRVTEWLTRVVIDHRDEIGREVHAAQLVDLRTAVYTDPLELHEGARRYYRSVKP